MSSSKKLREGEEALAKAEKLLTTSMFRWSPDYMAASPYLEKAAEAFRAGQALDRAAKTFVRLAEVQHKNGAVFRAAMHMETAAKIHLQYAPKQPAPAMQYYQLGSAYYSEMGELGKAAEMLLKGATALEAVGMMDVKHLYLEACDLMETQDKPHFAVDTFRKTAAFLIKRKDYADAVGNYERQIALFRSMGQKENMYKCFASIVVLKCAMQDVIAADQAYMAHLQDDGFLSSDECALSEDLIGALKRSDDALLQVVLKKPTWQYLDTSIGRLVRTISLYGSAKPAASKTTTFPPSTAQAPPSTMVASSQSASFGSSSTAPASAFSFDELEFSSSPAVDTAAAMAALHVSAPPSTATAAPATQPAPVAPASAPIQSAPVTAVPTSLATEEDMFDLT
ncbi:gamma-soluble NSF attachment protein [Achlya hypogyna]|uniref:Gamma-soluble NSF attachment protein n=1 Tax=Achlya hypogyna TaxID=1202772 RepID=A0A1V9Z540_ACHHY|nr:gamma-soluble NSF attachment protein [Achlya hypogyna]